MNLILPIHSMFLLVLLLIVFFSKDRMKSDETKLYCLLIIISFFNVLFNIVGIYLGYNDGDMNFLYILNHLDLPLYFWWASILFVYLMYVYKFKENKNKYNKIKRYVLYMNVVFTVVSVFLPFEVIITDKAGYAIGICVNFTYFICAIYLILCMIVTFFLIKKNNFKKTIPIFSFILLGIIAAIIQKNIPSLIIIPSMIVFVEFVMYFTIENPDMKLLEEVHKSKEISDNSNEEKILFLYNMTQEIRNTTNEIDDNIEMILESDNIDDGKEYAREIKIITSKFKTMTNEIFDVSKLDSAYIKVYNNKYNVKNIFKEIVTMYSNKCKIKNLDFRVNIDHDVPEVLYGDSISLKEVLSIILDNSLKYTKEGYVEFHVNIIIKNDVCRLMITIEDSGVGIKSEDINKMKIDNRSLSKANKLITLMNGTMMMSSNYGFGTKVKVILDQKIDVVKNIDIVNYEEIYENIKILMVDDSDSGIKIIDRLIKGSSIKMDFAMNGKECIDKIKSYGRYDIILLDEQLSQISGLELIKKIKNIKNFKIPVILLTKDNIYDYNDEFKNLGFSDYLLKPIKKDELLDKINKYVKKGK